MKSSPLRFALREMNALGRRPRVWLALAAISLLLGLVGPFETFEHPLLTRLAYWTLIVVTTGALGAWVTLLVMALLPPAIPPSLGAALGGLLAGTPIALLVWTINNLAYGPQDDGMSLGSLIAYCIPIAALVTTLGHVVRDAVMPPTPLPPSAGSDTAPAPPLLDRLPLPQRGRLLHLAVKDHYVDVTTDRGTTLVLIRLSDAIRETAPLQGLQVHRSHWVALDAVRRSARRSGKPVLELENGAIVPVSRSFLPDVRSAGLL